jgi:hypothetical protein
MWRLPNEALEHAGEVSLALEADSQRNDSTGGLKALSLANATIRCVSACNFDPVSRGIGVQN